MLTNTIHKAGKGTDRDVSKGLLLLTAPLIGFFYVVSLPFIGIAAVATLASGIIMTKLYDTAAKSVSFGWRPATSHLSGKGRKK